MGSVSPRKTTYALFVITLCASFAVSPAGTSVSSVNGTTSGACGAFFILGGVVLGSQTCQFTIDVQAESIGNELFWDNLLEPAVSFEWGADAEADSPSPNDLVNFHQHWQGFSLTQNPDLPQMIGVITPDRVGLWRFTATYTPSLSPGTPVSSPDTGWWQVKACLDPPGPDPITGDDGGCILTSQNPTRS